MVIGNLEERAREAARCRLQPSIYLEYLPPILPLITSEGLTQKMNAFLQESRQCFKNDISAWVIRASRYELLINQLERGMKKTLGDSPSPDDAIIQMAISLMDMLASEYRDLKRVDEAYRDPSKHVLPGMIVTDLKQKDKEVKGIYVQRSKAQWPQNAAKDIEFHIENDGYAPTYRGKEHWNYGRKMIGAVIVTEPHSAQRGYAEAVMVGNREDMALPRLSYVREIAVEPTDRSLKHGRCIVNNLLSGNEGLKCEFVLIGDDAERPNESAVYQGIVDNRNSRRVSHARLIEQLSSDILSSLIPVERPFRLRNFSYFYEVHPAVDAYNKEVLKSMGLQK